MMRKLIGIFFVLVFLEIKSQVNIVPNPSFESTLSCPYFSAGWTSCANWNNVNMNPGDGNWGTPDYFHPCGTGNTAPPATFGGTCSPQSGNAMMACCVYNVPYPEFREYISTQLTSSMQPGLTYTVSFWLSNGTGIKSPWTIGNIGAHFSTSPLTQVGWGVINVVPQCMIPSNVISMGWTQYTFTVIPSAAWKYITLGAFRTDAFNNPQMSFPNPGGNPSVWAYYFIDDVEVLSPDFSDVGIIDFYPKDQLIRLYPNPVKDKLTIEIADPLIKKFKCSIINALGQIVFSEERSNSEKFGPNFLMDLDFLQSGVYFIYLEFNSGKEVLKMIKD